MGLVNMGWLLESQKTALKIKCRYLLDRVDRVSDILSCLDE